MTRLSKAILASLRSKAKVAASGAYAPYSHFPVGAAVLTKSGQVFSGCNVENSSFGLTICAERNAVFQAVQGEGGGIEAVVIYAGDDGPTPPCGACRQVISEFGPDAVVYSFSHTGRAKRWTLRKLLPGPFGPSGLTTKVRGKGHDRVGVGRPGAPPQGRRRQSV